MSGFFKLNTRHILTCISHSHGARYYIGQLRDGTFTPEEHHRMNWSGGPCFAPETLVDDQNRRIFWAWVLDQRKGERIIKNELGVMTLPRVLTLDAHGHLKINPPSELKKLRQNNRHLESQKITPKKDLVLQDIQGDCMELSIQAVIPENCIFGVKVRISHDGAEQTVILLDVAARTLSIDTSQSSLRPDIYQPFPLMWGETRRDVRVQTAPFMLEADEVVKLRIFIDKSILAVFANGRQCVTQRIYPTLPDSLHFALFSQRETIMVHSIDVWDMRATNPQEGNVL